MANILCDVDGILADWNSSFIKLLTSIEPKNVDPWAADFPATWNWPKNMGFTEETIEKAWTEVKHSGMFWKSLHPYATAYEDLKFLNKIRQANDIYFVTQRPGKTAKVETEKWLSGRGFETPTVVICDRKDLFCRAANVEIMIEDNPEKLLKAPPETVTALFKRPYNEGYWGYFNKTVSSVREALKDVV